MTRNLVSIVFFTIFAPNLDKHKVCQTKTVKGMGAQLWLGGRLSFRIIGN